MGKERMGRMGKKESEWEQMIFFLKVWEGRGRVGKFFFGKE